MTWPRLWSRCSAASCFWPSHYEGGALQARLLTARLVDDLGLETASLGPLEVHTHQHLDPVLRLHRTLADRDGDDGVVVGVGVGEEKVELVRAELVLDRRALLLDLRLELRIALGQLVQLPEVTGPPLEAVPGGDQGSVVGALTRHLAGAPGG